jgi:hypothetical protein
LWQNSRRSLTEVSFRLLKNRCRYLVDRKPQGEYETGWAGTHDPRWTAIGTLGFPIALQVGSF